VARLLDRGRDGPLRIETLGLCVLERTVYRGPHLYSATPMVRIQADLGALEHWPTSKLPGFTQALLATVPGLSQHGCCYHEAGGFVRRLEAGTWLGHVIEHVALELQNEAGFAVTRGKTRSVTGRAGVYNIMFEYGDEELALRAARLAFELVDGLLPANLSGVRGLDRIADPLVGADLAAKRAALAHMAAKRRLGPTTAALAAAARDRDIPVTRLDDRSLIRFGWGRAQHIMRASISGRTSHLGVETAGDKHLAKALLRSAGLPTPQGTLVTDAKAAIEAARRLGFPVVVKPLDANHGRGVATNVRFDEAVRAAFGAAQQFSRRVIVEQFYRGADYRVLVIGGEIAAVAERMPAHVIGDGSADIAQLIALKNADPRRGRGHANVLTRIDIDAGLEAMLASVGLALDAVPARGQKVVLRATANISTGGEAIDRTDDIHPDNAAIARRAAAMVGLDIAGIDIVCPDISRSMRLAGGGIVEVNAAPGFRMHLQPSQGRKRDVAAAAVRHLIRRGDGRIPVIAITGTNGKSTTARMVAHILRQTGARVGLTSTSGVYVDDECLWKGDASGPKSARMLFADPSVDVAVLETARGGIVREGLAFDRCDVGAVLNVSADHLGLGGVNTIDDLAAIKSVVTESVARRGVSVLNGDDPLTRAMARHAGGRVCYFSLRGDQLDADLQRHVDEGGRAAFRETRGGRDTLVLYCDGRRTPLMRVGELGAALGGAALFNVENALAAAAICHARGVAPKLIRMALASFTSSFEQNPGRMNIYDEHGFRVIVDYAHNPAALRALAALTRKLATRYNRTLASVSTPGDRRDEDIREMGRIAGQTFDHVVFRERPDTRGRAAHEVMALLSEGARQAGMPEEAFECVPAEEDATQRCLELAAPGDFVVLMPTDVEAAWRQVLSFTPASTPRAPHAPLARDAQPELHTGI
jgi:cyanophycin synthetase